MEETNYHRRFEPGFDAKTNTIARSSPINSKTGITPVEKESLEMKKNGLTVADVEHKSNKDVRQRTYLNKLKVFDRQELLYPNRLRRMVIRPFVFLSFPVIFYAGFSYGASLIWFNVLNGTSSLILSQKPYAFSSSMVGLSYLSPLIGVTLG